MFTLVAYSSFGGLFDISDYLTTAADELSFFSIKVSRFAHQAIELSCKLPRKRERFLGTI